MATEITGKSLGKHIGHACEGHLRGLLIRIAVQYNLEVRRDFPFDFHVNPDAVVVERSGAVRLVAIVAYWNHVGSSEKKLYRTRSEYVGAQQAKAQVPQNFTKDSKTVTVLYGASGGWKAQILLDLKKHCSPCLYLPDLLGVSETESLVSDVFELYKAHIESGASKSREFVERHVAQNRNL